MTIEKVNQKVTYGPTIGSSGRSDINAVRQVEGLAVARYLRSMRWRLMRRRSMRWKPIRRTGIFDINLYERALEQRIPRTFGVNLRTVNAIFHSLIFI